MNTYPYVFLSYSRRDVDIMHRVRDTLRDEGTNVWVDEGIEPGTPLWDRAVEDALKSAACVLVILTPNVIDSKGVRDEIHFAGLHRVHIFTVLAQGEPSESVPYTLSGNQWVDIRKNYTTNMARLMTAIQNHIGIKTPVAEAAPPVEQPRATPVSPPTPAPPPTKLAAEPISNDLPSNRLLARLKTVTQYILAFMFLIFGGLVIGWVTGLFAQYRYRVIESPSLWVNVQSYMNLLIAIIVVMSLIFPRISTWLQKRGTKRAVVFSIVIVMALIAIFFSAERGFGEGLIFIVLALVSALFALPQLFSRIFPYIERAFSFARTKL
ncbi:MAG: toll/interleukin-1 receptor domain-containing protein [Chloroflexi bacterium]|nr:toll/interleukin-1 receptor domain-containing protein [Chloroflexota bacterium]MCC6895257.1 toll/interleukin-1 receptor domain-containing protein [Anaerolineae bacterium]